MVVFMKEIGDQIVLREKEVSKTKTRKKYQVYSRIIIYSRMETLSNHFCQYHFIKN